MLMKIVCGGIEDSIMLTYQNQASITTLQDKVQYFTTLIVSD